jgi:hypothetical protein
VQPSPNSPRTKNVLTDHCAASIRSRVEGNKRAARGGGPIGSQRPGFAVGWPEDDAVDDPKGGPGHGRTPGALGYLVLYWRRIPLSIKPQKN